jgi:hypothetical protein
LTSDREHDEIRIEAIGFIGDQAPDAHASDHWTSRLRASVVQFM